MNKMFTAVAVAQLARRAGSPSPTPSGKHLPDYPNKAVAEKVTIHHLLTHTSGVGDYFNDKYMEAAKDRFRHGAGLLPPVRGQTAGVRAGGGSATATPAS